MVPPIRGQNDRGFQLIVQTQNCRAVLKRFDAGQRLRDIPSNNESNTEDFGGDVEEFIVLVWSVHTSDGVGTAHLPKKATSCRPSK